MTGVAVPAAAGLRAAAAERKRARTWDTAPAVPEGTEARLAALEARAAELERRAGIGVVVPATAPEFRPPVTAGEWLDDRVTAFGSALAHDPAAGLVIEVAGALRDGDGAALEAVLRGARRLGAADQYRAYGILRSWQVEGGLFPPGGAAIRQALDAWARAGLAEQRPEPPGPPARKGRR